jgi:hypothetical protein
MKTARLSSLLNRQLNSCYNWQYCSSLFCNASFSSVSRAIASSCEAAIDSSTLAVSSLQERLSTLYMLDRGLAFGCQRIRIENTLSTLFVRERVVAVGGSCMGMAMGSAA